MAGRHRRHSHGRSTVAKRGGTGLAAAAISATGLSTAVVTGTTAAVAPNVQLMALVSAANSTSQFFAGSSYYGTDWTDEYGAQQVVPFFRGPQGIANVINAVQDEDFGTGVTASGWGAGQTGTALGILAANDDTPALRSLGLVILDNNSNRAGGGFWTTYSAFAPLLFTSADPTPSDITVDGQPLRVLDVAYEYNINSDAPVDPLNPFAIGNSLAAYAFGYGEESRALDITQPTNGGPVFLNDIDTDGDGVKDDTITLEPGRHYIVKDGVVINGNGQGEAVPGTTTYVTVATENLPLTRPLRLIPGGDILADALDPALTDLVNAGYNDGKGTTANPAIPQDPTVPRPMKPFSSLSALGADDVQDSVREGATAGATAASQDFADPGNFITKPDSEFRKLPLISSLPNSAVSTVTLTTQNKVSTEAAKSGTASKPQRPRPLKDIADNIRSTLKKLAGADRDNEPSENTDED